MNSGQRAAADGQDAYLGIRLLLGRCAAEGVVALTGDDTPEDIVDHGYADGDAIGLNIWVAQYAGVDPINAAIFMNCFVVSTCLAPSMKEKV